MKSTFNRDYDNSLNLKESQNSLIVKMMDDVSKGEAFLAFRPKKQITIYMKGRKLCVMNPSNNYSPEIESKCLPILKSSSNEGAITENKWKEKTGVSEFSWGDIYTEIKDNLGQALSPEAEISSGLYKFSPMATIVSPEIILLDIEAKFSYSKKEENNNDSRIDLVLYNINTRQLAFVEVKRFDDDRLQKNGDLQEEIKKQLRAYEKLIKSEKNDIIREYNKTIKAYSSIYKISIEPIDEKMNILLSLLITDYSSGRKKTVDRLAEQLHKSDLKNISVLKIGNIENASLGTLKRWFSKMQKTTIRSN